jgi:ABC-type thiamin/hydroxymethylpyrimidine transport system permease subunit
MGRAVMEKNESGIYMLFMCMYVRICGCIKGSSDCIFCMFFFAFFYVLPCSLHLIPFTKREFANDILASIHFYTKVHPNLDIRKRGVLVNKEFVDNQKSKIINIEV